MRTAISAETGRKLPDGILPVIEKGLKEKKVIESALMANAFMRGLSRVQFDKVPINHMVNIWQGTVKLRRPGSFFFAT